MMWRITNWRNYLIERKTKENLLDEKFIEEFNYRFSEELELFILIYIG
ncbi:MAG: hypothetical protein KA198_00270 [Chitinophagaceae bacterium]|nr:hypothetical protein [Chitinophagaceae bacterium]